MKFLALALVMVSLAACSTANNGVSGVKGESAPSASPDGLTTVNLKQADITALVGVFSRVHVTANPRYGDGVCSSATAVIESRVKGSSPAKWIVSFGNSSFDLTQSEVRTMNTMFRGLKVMLEVSGITLDQQVTITSETCEFDPASWTARYKQAQ